MENIHALTRGTMEVAGQTVRDTPSIPTVEEMKLRLALEFEELFEKAEAMGLMGSFESLINKSFIKKSEEFQKVADAKGGLNEHYAETPLNVDHLRCTFRDTNIVNLVEVLDAALDQRVVASGTDLCFGFQHVIPDGDEAVYVSNMSKFDTEEAVAMDGVEAYAEKGIETYIQEVRFDNTEDVYYIIKRKSDNKYLKSLNYSPVDLRSLVGINEPAED